MLAGKATSRYVEPVVQFQKGDFATAGWQYGECVNRQTSEKYDSHSIESEGRRGTGLASLGLLLPLENETEGHWEERKRDQAMTFSLVA